MHITYRYRWKELTDDGLLKDPKDCGAYYEAENVNGWNDGHNSEQEANEAFLALKKKHYWSCPRELVLVKIARIED